MIQMIKTKSHIEGFVVNGGQPKNATSFPIVVRAPKHLRCFRATITVQTFNSNVDSALWISTAPCNSEELMLFIASNTNTNTAIAPATDITYQNLQSIVLDRRGVGYMEDEFYFYADEAYCTIIWEGEVYE